MRSEVVAVATWVVGAGGGSGEGDNDGVYPGPKFGSEPEADPEPRPKPELMTAGGTADEEGTLVAFRLGFSALVLASDGAMLSRTTTINGRALSCHAGRGITVEVAVAAIEGDDCLE